MKFSLQFIAILLLLLPLGVIRASTGNIVVAIEALQYDYVKDHLRQTANIQNPEAILTSTWFSNTHTGVQSGFGGGCGLPGMMPDRLGELLYSAKEIKIELRRWKLLYSCIRLAQLEAHYPMHSFW